MKLMPTVQEQQIGSMEKMPKGKNLKVVNFFDPDKNKKLMDYHENGGLPGLELGFSCLNGFYTHKQSGVTDWTGFPASGKTYFVLEILMQLSEKYGKRHAIYVPDLGTYYETFAKLVKMYTGKDFEVKYHNQISVGELMSRIPQISKDFLILIKEDYKKPLAPQQFWDFVAEYEDELGRLDTGLIDSWKNMSRDTDLPEYQYLDIVLPYRNEVAEQGNVHFHTIAHPNKTEITDQKTENGNRKRRVPTAQDIKGGESWYANGKNIITVDRSDKQTTYVDLHIWKTKPENVGMEGTISDVIHLDRKRGRYCESYNGGSLFAFEYLGAGSKTLIPQDRISNIKEGVDAMRKAKEDEEKKKMHQEILNPFAHLLPLEINHEQNKEFWES